MKKLALTLLATTVLMSAGVSMAATSSNAFSDAWNSTKKSYTDAVKSTHESNKAAYEKKKKENQEAQKKKQQEALNNFQKKIYGN